MNPIPAFLTTAPVPPPAPPALVFPPGTKRIYFSDGWKDGLYGWTRANSPEINPGSGISQNADVHTVIVGSRNVVRFALSGVQSAEGGQAGARLSLGNVAEWTDLAPYLNQPVAIDATLYFAAPLTLASGANMFLEAGLQLKTDPTQGAVIATLLRAQNNGAQFWMRSAVEGEVTNDKYPLISYGVWQQIRMNTFLSADPTKGSATLLFNGQSLTGHAATMTADGRVGLYGVLYGNNVDSAEMYIGDVGISLLAA